MRRPAPTLLLTLVLTASSQAHDIPNARVDRSIQATVEPGRPVLDYYVSLSEPTLTKVLRALSDAEERRTRQVKVSFWSATAYLPPPALVPHPGPRPPAGRPSRPSDRLSRLLDRASRVSLLGLGLIAFGLGAAHAIQPGH